MIRKKILLLGDFAVGKTSLIRRYVDNAFDDKYLTTVGVKISRKRLETEGEQYELLIWDIEGATPFKEIPKNYYAGASGAIVVGDVSRNDTIENLQKHIDNFLSQNPDVPYLVAYNKTDLLSEAQRHAIVSSGDHIFTSAKTGENVPLLFESLLERIIHAAHSKNS